MSDFPFDFSIDYKMENCKIRPPSNFSILEHVVFEKYDLNSVSISYLDYYGIEHPIRNDMDYAKLIDDACNANIKEVELVLHTKNDTSKQRKKSLRKRSAMPNEGPETSVVSNEDTDKNFEDGETGTFCDYDYFGDNRNKKMMMEDNRYIKHSKNFTDKKRIYYIKEKKGIIKDDDYENDKNEMDVDDDEENEQRKRKNKRQLKCNRKEKCEDRMEIDDINSKKIIGIYA